MLLQSRRNQKELRDQHDRLEQIVGERTANLAREIEQRKQTLEELKAERERLRHALDLQEKERRLIAYEIHDGLAQQLAGAVMQFQSLRLSTSDPSPDTLRAFVTVQKLLEESLRETRSLINGLRPPNLDEDGVEAAIEELIARSQVGGEVEIEFYCDLGLHCIAPVLEKAIFRIVQEGLNNARRYSQSGRIRIVLVAENGTISIEIQDWGIGFDTSAVPQHHFGLEGIRERARLFGGQAIVESALDKGTRIAVNLPLVPSFSC